MSRMLHTLVRTHQHSVDEQDGENGVERLVVVVQVGVRCELPVLIEVVQRRLAMRHRVVHLEVRVMLVLLERRADQGGGSQAQSCRHSSVLLRHLCARNWLCVCAAWGSLCWLMRQRLIGRRAVRRSPPSCTR